MSPNSSEPQPRFTWFYGLARFLLRILFRLFYRWRILHAERVPLHGPLILAANHASFLDPPVIGSSLDREISYLARKSLFRFPVIGTCLRKWNAVPVDVQGGGASGVLAILDRLNAGGAIILFPEGTRTHDGHLQPARSGIGLVVAKSHAPVVPVLVEGTYHAWHRHQHFPRPGKITVTYGEPMLFQSLREEAKTCSKQRVKEIYQAISNQIMAKIAALKSEG